MLSAVLLISDAKLLIVNIKLVKNCNSYEELLEFELISQKNGLSLPLIIIGTAHDVVTTCDKLLNVIPEHSFIYLHVLSIKLYILNASLLLTIYMKSPTTYINS